MTATKQPQATYQYGPTSPETEAYLRRYADRSRQLADLALMVRAIDIAEAREDPHTHADTEIREMILSASLQEIQDASEYYWQRCPEVTP